MPKQRNELLNAQKEGKKCANKRETCPSKTELTEQGYSQEQVEVFTTAYASVKTQRRLREIQANARRSKKTTCPSKAKLMRHYTEDEANAYITGFEEKGTYQRKRKRRQPSIVSVSSSILAENLETAEYVVSSLLNLPEVNTSLLSKAKKAGCDAAYYGNDCHSKLHLMSKKKYTDQQADSYIASYQATKARLLRKKEKAILSVLDIQTSHSSENEVASDTDATPQNDLYFDFGRQKMSISDNAQIKNQETVINCNAKLRK